jgi:hypothetical protein
MPDERVNPRISVNKLGEYLCASPARRRTIIRDQKHPSDFVVARYNHVYDAIVDYLCSGNDMARIFQAIDTLRAIVPDTDFKEQDKLLSINALESFSRIANNLTIEGANYSSFDRKPPRLHINGVDISVRPEIQLIRSIRNNSKVGFFKLYIGKTHRLTQEAAAYIGALIRMYTEAFIAELGDYDPHICKVVDVFSEKIYPAPASYVRRMNDIEAACDEISRTWNYY